MRNIGDKSISYTRHPISYNGALKVRTAPCFRITFASKIKRINKSSMNKLLKIIGIVAAIIAFLLYLLYSYMTLNASCDPDCEAEEELTGTWEARADSLETDEGTYFFTGKYTFQDNHKVVRQGQISYTCHDAEKGWYFTGVVPFSFSGKWEVEGDSVKMTYEDVEFGEMKSDYTPPVSTDFISMEQMLVEQQFAQLTDWLRSELKEEQREAIANIKSNAITSN